MSPPRWRWWCRLRTAGLLLAVACGAALLATFRQHGRASVHGGNGNGWKDIVRKAAEWRASTSTAEPPPLSGAEAALRYCPLGPSPLERPGVLHFLFMLDGDLLNMPLWRSFFVQAPRGSATVWVHCSNPAACDVSRPDLALPGLRVVQTVPSKRCLDLVTPQAQLMKAVLEATPKARGVPEKFVLLSGSDLPIKPFAFVHATLLASVESDFCFQSPRRWRKATIDNTTLYLVKHSQWVVLNRTHARRFVRDWVPVGTTDQWSLVVRGRRWAGRSQQVFVERQLDRCADEFAVFATLFGMFAEGDAGPARCPVNRTVGECPTRESLMKQSRCRTLVFFNRSSALLEEIKGDPLTHIHQAKMGGHPVEFERLGVHSLWALRASRHLFVRKVRDEAVVLADYCQVVLGGTLASADDLAARLAALPPLPPPATRPPPPPAATPPGAGAAADVANTSGVPPPPPGKADR